MKSRSKTPPGPFWGQNQGGMGWSATWSPTWGGCAYWSTSFLYVHRCARSTGWFFRCSTKHRYSTMALSSSPYPRTL